MRPRTPTRLREPLNNSARARRRLCGIARCGFGERGLVIPNEGAETQRETRKGPSRQGFASKAASRTRANPRSRTASSLRETAIPALGRCALIAVAKATVTRVAAQATQACRFAAGKEARWSAVKRVHDLRLLRLKRAPRRVIQRLLKAGSVVLTVPQRGSSIQAETLLCRKSR